MTPYGTLIDRVAGTCGALPAAERVLAERVLAICRELDGRARSDGRPGDRRSERGGVRDAEVGVVSRRSHG